MDCQEVELVFISDTEEDEQNEYIFLSDTEEEEEEQNEYIFLSDTEEEEEQNELTTYSYINNGIYFEYFVGYEIAALIGYKNPAEVIKSNVSISNKLAFKDYPGAKYPKIDERTILITRDGAIELLIKTRKLISPDVLHLLKTFGIETTNRKCLTKEQQTLSHIANVFKTEKFEDQFKVGSYYLDMYFTEYKIAIEADENGHKDRKPGDERDRMDFVNFELNITDENWIRYNPDEYEFDIMKVIGRIYRKIDEIKEKNSKHTTIVYDSTHRKCINCNEIKLLKNNFKYNRLICNTCNNITELTNKEKEVFQYDMDGNYIAKYSSIKEAASSTGLYSCQIGSICNRKTHMIKKMVFRFSTDEGIEEGKNIEPVKYYSSKKIVAKYDRDGKYIETYECASEAAKQIGASKEAIIAACKKSFLSHGFLWRYLEDINSTEDIKGYVYVPNRKYMRHVEVYKDDVLYKSFPSIVQAAKEMNLKESMCRKFLYGKKADPKGFVWKFLEIK